MPSAREAVYRAPRLAPLPEQRSFAGSDSSHDFVEAALMRRQGGRLAAYDPPRSSM